MKQNTQTAANPRPLANLRLHNLMNNLPSWFPGPRSWFNALGLILLMLGIQHLSIRIWEIVTPILHLPRVGLLLYCLVFIAMPIALIALAHHWLHRLLDQFLPDSPSLLATTANTTTPNLMSWWEGFYGWMVYYLASLVWIVCFGLIHPFPFGIATLTTPQVFANLASGMLPLKIVEIVVKIVAAALLYHFELAMKRHLMASDPNHL